MFIRNAASRWLTTVHCLSVSLPRIVLPPPCLLAPLSSERSAIRVPSLFDFQILPGLSPPPLNCQHRNAFLRLVRRFPILLPCHRCFSISPRAPLSLRLPSSSSSSAALPPLRCVLVASSVCDLAAVPLSLSSPFVLPSAQTARAASPQFSCIFGCGAEETVQRPPLVSPSFGTYASGAGRGPGKL